MKRVLLFAIIAILSVSLTEAQQSLNMTMLSNWDDPSLPSGWTGQYSDVWGYADNQNREYAILGVMFGTYFIDVTDPVNPVVIDYVASKDQVNHGVHRDYKTYQHYCYAVSDEGQNSLQIIDMQYLPDSVHVVYDSDVLSRRCHNIFISDEKLYLASNTVGNSFNAMDVFSLANPESPTFLSTLFSTQFYHVHDVFVKNDTAYCSNGNDGLFVYDYSDPVNPSLISSLTMYPQQGYNHSSWVTDDSRTIVFADENHGKAMKLYDIADIQNPALYGMFQTNLLNVPNPSSQDGSIPHNPFIVGDKVIISYYHDGVQIYDISDPNNITNVAYYDTYPQAVNYAGYQGCWGVYPYLPSGKILASDISNGLFVLDASTVLGIGGPDSPSLNIVTYPNPFNSELNIMIPQDVNGSIVVELFDMAGKLVYTTEGYFAGTTLNVPVVNLAKGVYGLKVNSGNAIYNKKVIRN